MQETWVQSLGWEDPLEEDMATHSSIVAWRFPMDRGAWWLIVHRVAKSHKEFVFVSRFTLFIRIPFILGKAHPNLIRFLGCEDLEKG